MAIFFLSKYGNFNQPKHGFYFIHPEHSNFNQPKHGFYFNQPEHGNFNQSEHNNFNQPKNNFLMATLFYIATLIFFAIFLKIFLS